MTKLTFWPPLPLLLLSVVAVVALELMEVSEPRRSRVISSRLVASPSSSLQTRQGWKWQGNKKTKQPDWEDKEEGSIVLSSKVHSPSIDIVRPLLTRCCQMFVYWRLIAPPTAQGCCQNWIDRWIDRRIDRQTDRQTDKQTQTDRQIDRYIEIDR